MKYIFLDFDGVINNYENDVDVDESNIKILKEILDRTYSRIIVISSNKYEIQTKKKIDYYSTNFYNNYIKKLNDYGIKIYDVTPNIDQNKSYEIKYYIQKHNIKDYAILDDALLDEELISHQVYVDSYKGLTHEYIEPIINILNDNLGIYPSNYEELNKERNSHLKVLRIK